MLTQLDLRLLHYACKLLLLQHTTQSLCKHINTEISLLIIQHWSNLINPQYGPLQMQLHAWNLQQSLSKLFICRLVLIEQFSLFYSSCMNKFPFACHFAAVTPTFPCCENINIFCLIHSFRFFWTQSANKRLHNIWILGISTTST